MKSVAEQARANVELQVLIRRCIEWAADELAGRALQHSCNAQDLRQKAAAMPPPRR